MNGKKWLSDVPHFESKYSATVNNMISLYIEAFHEFFSIPLTSNESEFMDKASQYSEKKSDFVFLNWIKEKGLPQLKKILILDLPFDSSVEAKMDFVISSLNFELNWEERDKKSTRSTIVNSLRDLAEQIIHLSSLALTKEDIEVKELRYKLHTKKSFDFLNKDHNKPLETVVIYLEKFVGGLNYGIK